MTAAFRAVSPFREPPAFFLVTTGPRICRSAALLSLFRVLDKDNVRRHFVRAGDANPQQLRYWTDAWLERIRDLYAAHDGLMAAWQGAAAPAPRGKEQAAAALDSAYAAWDQALAVIDEARKKQMAAPGLQEPAKKALATLDREWDGLIAHRDYPMVSLDNYADAAVMPMFTVRGGSAAGRGGALAA